MQKSSVQSVSRASTCSANARTQRRLGTPLRKAERIDIFSVEVALMQLRRGGAWRKGLAVDARRNATQSLEALWGEQPRGMSPL